MMLGEYIKRLLCPSCIEMEAGLVRRKRTVSILEQSGESLDRMTDELRVIRRSWLESPNDLSTAMRGVVKKEARRP